MTYNPKTGLANKGNIAGGYAELDGSADVPADNIDPAMTTDSELSTHTSAASPHSGHATLSSGKVPTSELGTGTDITTKFLRGDQSWQTVAGGSTPTGTGFRHITTGSEDAASKLVENADVHTSAAIVESKLSLNYATHSNASDPTSGEKSALAGTAGTPSGTNKYVTNDDTRNTDARTPASHDNTYHSATFITGSSPTISTPALTLETGTTPTAEGRIQWDSTNDRIVVGDSIGTKVYEPASQTSVHASATSVGSKTLPSGTIVGTTDSQTLSGKKVQLEKSPASDQTYSGDIINDTVGETVAFGDILYYKSLDSKWWKADADAATTMPAMVMAVAAITANNAGDLLLRGFVRNDTPWNWTVGGLLYADTTTAGAMTQTAPSGTGDQVQIVGFAKTADIVFFNPNYAMVEIV